MRVLIVDIASGEVQPGEMLSREADLAFSVSRGVARESIRGLEERGLVTVKHGRGATVKEDVEWDVFSPDVLVHCWTARAAPSSCASTSSAAGSWRSRRLVWPPNGRPERR